MDYKEVIPNRNMRKAILGLFDFIPDKTMVKIQYRIKTGRKLNLTSPIRYTEKLQWYKIYYRNSLMKQCANKYNVRAYVCETVGAEYLVPLIGVFDTAEEIDFAKLPNKFVAKDTLGGGNNEVFICSDKSQLDETVLRNTLNNWVNMGRGGKHPGREWVYDRSQGSQILIEEYIEPKNTDYGLFDYKFLCFDGKVDYLYVVGDRKQGDTARLSIHDAHTFEMIDAKRMDERAFEFMPPKPERFNKMREIAEQLAAPFPHVRVDLYDAQTPTGILFGELTFFDGSGYFSFDPDSFDKTLGSCFKVPEL